MENHKKKKNVDKSLSARVPEYDYLLKIWGPLIEGVIDINNFIRMKKVIRGSKYIETHANHFLLYHW